MMTKTILAATAAVAMIWGTSAVAAPLDAAPSAQAAPAKSARVTRAGAKLSRTNRQDQAAATGTGGGLGGTQIALMALAVGAVVAGTVAATDNPNSP